MFSPFTSRFSSSALPEAFLFYTSLICLACLFFLMTGCNLMSDFSREGESSDPKVLYEDATIALQRGEPEKAADYLRKTLEKDSSYAEARVKLGTAVLEHNDIDAVDFVRIARTLSDKIGDQRASATLSGASAAPSGSCSFPSSYTAEVFDPTAIANFDELRASHEALTEVRTQTRRLFGSGDVPAAAERLINGALSERMVAEALLNGTLAYAARTYVDLAESGGDDLTFYRVQSPGSNDVYMGYCAPDEATLERLLSAAACLMSDLDYGRRLLRTRADLLGAERAQELADKADEAYRVLNENLAATCSAG